jgi:hypothetical protein
VKARQKTTERCPYVQEVFLIARQGISNGWLKVTTRKQWQSPWRT